MALMTDRLDLPGRYRKVVEALLREHVPDAEVWAYGSRVNGMSHPGSDLDLVLRSPTLEQLGDGYYDLVEAFQESNVPILIQAHDWARLPESFHREIEREYVVVQEGAEQTTAGEWREVVLGDVCDFRAGSVFKLHYQGQDAGDYPFIKVSDMNLPANQVCIREANNWIFQDVVNASRAKPLPSGTIVFAKIGEALKHNRLRMVIQPTIVDNNMMGAIPRADTVDPKFLFYAMHQFDLGEFADGTALPYLTVASLANLPLGLPPLPEQRAIAHILGTLDDKIELNRRMNETLEEMARALFQSWFVDFDPVRARMEGRDTGLPPDLAALFPDRLVDSELGEVPQGWEVRALGDVAKQRRSGARPEEIDSDTPYIALEHMPKRCIALSEWGRADGLASNKFRFERGDILFGKLRPYFHKVGVAPLDGVCSTDIVVIYPVSEDWFGFLLGHVSSREFVDYTDAGATGTRCRALAGPTWPATSLRCQTGWWPRHSRRDSTQRLNVCWRQRITLDRSPHYATRCCRGWCRGHTNLNDDAQYNRQSSQSHPRNGSQ